MARKRAVSGALDVADDGLGRDVPVKELALALHNADVENGVIARFVETTERENTDYNRRQKMHTFELGESNGRARFSLWGSMQLDQKLREIRSGEIVFVQYMGKAPGRTSQHNWSVRPFGGTTQQLQELLKRYERGIRQVVAAIESARKQRGQSSVSEDDDLPF